MRGLAPRRRRRLLGVSRTTLYAYVSRGFVRSQASPGSTRERTYSRDDVERLRRRTEERRAPDKAAARALQWGMPILESSIALIDGRRLYYRGHDAATLARSRSLEDVAALIWTGQFETMRATSVAASSRRRRRPIRSSRARSRCSRPPPLAIRIAFDLRPASVALTGGRILRLLHPGRDRLGPRWTRRSTPRSRGIGTSAPRGAEIVRAALVLCADHELNVSSFTARCVASAGSHPYAVVIAGLAALEGPKHGGASARVESMLESLRPPRTLAARGSRRSAAPRRIDRRLRTSVCTATAIRARRLLLELLGERYPKSAEYRFVKEFAQRRHWRRPANIRTSTSASPRSRACSSCRRGAPLMLFAIGRSVGWIGHAIEQYATGQLIRPRAKYVGVPPATG